MLKWYLLSKPSFTSYPKGCGRAEQKWIASGLIVEWWLLTKWVLCILQSMTEWTRSGIQYFRHQGYTAEKGLCTPYSMIIHHGCTNHATFANACHIKGCAILQRLVCLLALISLSVPPSSSLGHTTKRLSYSLPSHSWNAHTSFTQLPSMTG